MCKTINEMNRWELMGLRYKNYKELNTTHDWLEDILNGIGTIEANPTVLIVSAKVYKAFKAKAEQLNNDANFLVYSIGLIDERLLGMNRRYPIFH